MSKRMRLLSARVLPAGLTGFLTASQLAELNRRPGPLRSRETSQRRSTMQLVASQRARDYPCLNPRRSCGSALRLA